MRIIFVGVHNKPGMKPLDSKTRSGNIIDKIIESLPEGIEVLKTNLFIADEVPRKELFISFNEEWYWTYLPNFDDIIILLGAIVHKEFIYTLGLKIIKLAHPASMLHHKTKEQTDVYVKDAIQKITEQLKQ
jgi:hypothetical protein